MTPFAGLAHGCPPVKGSSTVKSVAGLSRLVGEKHCPVFEPA
jgi:hypothetical protein